MAKDTAQWLMIQVDGDVTKHLNADSSAVRKIQDNLGAFGANVTYVGSLEEGRAAPTNIYGTPTGEVPTLGAFEGRAR